jgi:glycosyltransferase involved in cell wall biosynthesis
MAEKTRRVLVIIPAYNESDRIASVVAGIREALREADVLVVNDCSADATAENALAAGAAVISHAINLGYGAALESGYLYAVSKDYDIVCQMDGDGQHQASELPLLLAPVIEDEADIVIGSRYLPGSGAYRTPLARRVGQRLFGAIVKLLSGHSVSDPTSGFQCLNARAVRFHTKGFFPYDVPDADVILLSHYAGLRIKEVPVAMLERTEGVSMHSGFKPVYYVAKMLLSIFIVALGFRRWKKYV